MNRSSPDISQANNTPKFVLVILRITECLHIPSKGNLHARAITEKIHYTEDCTGDSGYKPEDCDSFGKCQSYFLSIISVR